MTCQNCGKLHHTWQCPEIAALLFAPFTDVCVSCGDQLHYDAPLNSICAACMEYEKREQLTAERDRWGVPLSLRADILADSLDIHPVYGF